MSARGYHPDYLPRRRWRTWLLPPLTVVLASMLVAWPAVVSSPWLPPLGLMMLLAWRLLRTDIWPVWAGLPLGLINDLYSGAPIGSAAFTWTAILVVHGFIDQRFVWRDHWIEWGLGALALIFAVLTEAMLSGGGSLVRVAGILLPQLGFSILFMPLVVQFVSLLDKWRLR